MNIHKNARLTLRGREDLIARTQAGLDAMDRAFPRMKSLYPQTATGPTECQDLLGMAFRTIHFDGLVRVPGYVDWFLECDAGPAYAYHRRMLKLLQWKCPPTQWHLKTPAHLFALEALDAAYPDARFIWTHRDPAEVIGSVCSLITFLRGMASESSETAELGARQVELWVEAIRRGFAFRDRLPAERIIDVRNDDLDPLGDRGDDARLAEDEPARRPGRARVRLGRVRVEQKRGAPCVSVLPRALRRLISRSAAAALARAARATSPQRRSRRPAARRSPPGRSRSTARRRASRPYVRAR